MKFKGKTEVMNCRPGSTQLPLSGYMASVESDCREGLYVNGNHFTSSILSQGQKNTWELRKTRLSLS